MTSPAPTPQPSGSAAAHGARHPDFFAQAPSLRVRDPLAGFLGAAEDGIVEYHYIDAVRLAGHSCPTVAAAWLMTIQGLRALYPEQLPERGGIDVYMRGERDEGVTGVMASVATLLTGATVETGFGGIGPAGRYSRRNLLHYGAPIEGTLALRRHDGGQAVQVDADTSLVPWGDEMRQLMPKAVAEVATPDELRRFGLLWQQRVRAMLVEHADDPRLIRVQTWQPRH
ncbi:MAG TPA: hypothetical protein PLT38_08195 [Rubrivivax sp.]|nr:hypothetical protein [Rubrivivax sp.]